MCFLKNHSLSVGIPLLICITIQNAMNISSLALLWRPLCLFSHWPVCPSKSVHNSWQLIRHSLANASNNFNEFISGFTECAKSVEQFLCESSSVNPNVMTSLSTHLNHCIQILRLDFNSHRVNPNPLQCSSPSHSFSSSPSLSQHSSVSFLSKIVNLLNTKILFNKTFSFSDYRIVFHIHNREMSYVLTIGLIVV